MKYIQILKTLVLTLILATSFNFAFGNWSAAPAGLTPNVPPPFNIGTDLQDKAGALTINQTANTVGMRVQNGIVSTSALPNAARVMIDEYADTSADWAGVELRKNDV